GRASYFDLVSGRTVAPRAAWTYAAPTRGFEPIAGAVAVMAAAPPPPASWRRWRSGRAPPPVRCPRPPV
ncbi:DUF427 domain-containing protein, partial [Mycolicibacterium diernhoferi]|uniref:DUF427 domain-containing protein n=1 Tax=Mycolicibacterium diernhoferi TaxID=1801 RepID=UPI0010552B4A